MKRLNYVLANLIAAFLTVFSALAADSNKIKVVKWGSGIEYVITGDMVPKGHTSVHFETNKTNSLEKVFLHRSCWGDLCVDPILPEDKGWDEWQKKFLSLGLSFEDQSDFGSQVTLKDDPRLWKVDSVTFTASKSEMFYLLKSGEKETLLVPLNDWEVTPPDNGQLFRLGNIGDKYIALIPTTDKKLMPDAGVRESFVIMVNALPAKQ